MCIFICLISRQLNSVKSFSRKLTWINDFCSSFKSVHWRVYIFAAIIFRAFIAPLGPQGIGVEHIRNIIYFMCHEDFVGWNDEQPGVHLRAVISKLFDCLGKGKSEQIMLFFYLSWFYQLNLFAVPNFFIQSQDLLKSIPTQNSRLVQAHLSKLKDNLVVYCIYAFRNLTVVQPEDTFYPMPNFKKLYNIITVPHERDLLQIVRWDTNTHTFDTTII